MKLIYILQNLPPDLLTWLEGLAGGIAITNVVYMVFFHFEDKKIQRKIKELNDELRQHCHKANDDINKGN